MLSTMSPIFAEGLDWADTVLLGYSWNCSYTLKAMVGLLNGEYAPVGVKPYK